MNKRRELLIILLILTVNFWFFAFNLKNGSYWLAALSLSAVCVGLKSVEWVKAR